ncbi:MAG TPA: hypothetical protein VMG12_07020, partial [Polyangiaceae bacterium]|nr:hypothetical protein [Polyangiaceae bacterium]
MTEPVREPTRGQLDDDAAARRLVNRRRQVALRQPRAPSHRRQLELGARRRRQFEQLGGRRRQPREAGADDLANALRSRELRKQRACEPQLSVRTGDRVRLDEGTPQLAHQERVA